MKFLKFALICLLPLQLISCSDDPEESTGLITGAVYDEADGNPLEGVSVVISPTGASVFTDEYGDFTFRDLQPQSYTLQFSKAGYRTLNRNVDVVAGGSQGVRFSMTRVEENAEISINPSSLNFGTTQSDMNVTIKNNGNATAEWTIDLGYNNWLCVSQTGGSIQPGRTQSITFSVDRNYIAAQKTVVVNLQAFGNSFPITISCAPHNATSEMTVEPTSLNFGSDLTNQTVTVRNTGKTPLNWMTSGISSSAIAVSPASGTVAPGGNSVVQVSLDRSQLNGAFDGNFIISDGIKEMTISVSANGGSTTPGGDDEPVAGLVATDGLAAYYQFNNTCDDSYNEFHGFDSGDANYVTGVSGEAFKFSKTTASSVTIPYGMIHNKAFAVSFWAKNISDGLLFYSTCSDNNVRFTLSVNSGKLKFIATRHPNYYEYDKTEREFAHPSISDNKWHHIVLTSDFGQTTYATWTTTLYLDGRRAGTITEYNSSNGELDKPNGFIVGGSVKMNSTVLTCPSFTIDNLRIYDTRTISATEVSEIYKAQQ